MTTRLRQSSVGAILECFDLVVGKWFGENTGPSSFGIMSFRNIISSGQTSLHGLVDGVRIILNLRFQKDKVAAITYGDQILL